MAKVIEYMHHGNEYMIRRVMELDPKGLANYLEHVQHNANEMDYRVEISKYYYKRKRCGMLVNIFS